MKLLPHKVIRVLLILFFCQHLTYSENPFHNPDKVYLHLDRNLYAQGDTIWLKGYVLQRGTNIPSNNSYAIHIQMLNQDGKMVGYHKLLTVDGEASGQIELLSVLKPGFYQLIAHTGYMKNFSQQFFFKTTIELREKVRQQSINTLFDKIAYKVGDTARVSFSVIDQNSSPVPNARFIYQYLYQGKAINRKGVKCNDKGSMTVKIPIEEGNSTNRPLLKLTYFAEEGDKQRKEQEIYIPLKKERIHLSFFPEGGDIIDGNTCKVAFKSNDDLGNPVTIEGILYKNGEKLEQVSSIHDGMGLFTITPELANYTFKITSPIDIDSIYKLPQVKKQGFSLSYIKQSKDILILSVAQNISDAQKCKLWVSSCDKLLFVRDVLINNISNIPISKKQLPKGIVTFTISDENDVPQAERLVYVNGTSPNININLEKEYFKTREKVNINLSINTKKIVNLSVAVVDSLRSYSSKLHNSNIKAYAELETELQGPITNINQYLGNSRIINYKRDLLLLTHGWRHFEWFRNNESLINRHVHNFNRVFGKVTQFGKPYPNANINALIVGKSIAFAEFNADEEGRFFLDPEYDTRSYDDMMILATNKKNKSNVTLVLQNTDTLLFASIIKQNANNIRPFIESNIQTNTDEKPVVIEEPFMFYDTYALKEFSVTSKRKDWDMSRYLRLAPDVKMGTDLEEFSSFDWLLSQTSNRVRLAGDNYTKPEIPYIEENNLVQTNCAVVETSYFDREDLMQFLGNSVYISLFDVELSSYFNESNPPSAMIYVNDKPVGYSTYLLDYIKKEDIIAVAVLNGAQGYERFGMEAYFGAILVYANADAVKRDNLKNNQALFGDFVEARKFHKQLFDTKEQSKIVADDKRVTLHWEPLLKTNTKGEAKVSFYTGDISGKKNVIIQGFDKDGNLYYETARFTVKDLFDR